MELRIRRIARLAGVLLTAALAVSGCSFDLGPMSRPKDEAARMLDSYRKQSERERLTAEQQTEESSPAAPAASPEQLLLQGDRLRDSGELASALYSYIQAHNADRSRAEPRERIAVLYLRDDPARAESIFETLLEESPYTARLHTGLALAQIAQGRLDEARDALAEAITLEPAAATPRSLIGVINDRLGDYEAARAEYEAAHELRPDDWVILNNLGVSLMLAGEYEEAVVRLRAGLRLQPRDAALRNNLGLALGLAGRHPEAFREFSSLGGEARAHNNLGWVLYLTGDYAGAIEHFEQAFAVGGDEVETVVRNIALAQQALREQRPAPLGGGGEPSLESVEWSETPEEGEPGA